MDDLTRWRRFLGRRHHLPTRSPPDQSFTSLFAQILLRHRLQDLINFDLLCCYRLMSSRDCILQLPAPARTEPSSAAFASSCTRPTCLHFPTDI